MERSKNEFTNLIPDKIPALMNANKDELIKDLSDINEKPKKRIVTSKKKIYS